MTASRALVAVVILLATLHGQDSPAPPDPAVGPTLVVLAKSQAQVVLLDPVSGGERARLPVGVGPHEAATSTDGCTVVVCNYGAREPGSSLTVIDIPTAKVSRQIELAREVGDGDERKTQRYFRPHGIQFLPDGKRVVVTSEVQRCLLVVDIGSGAVVEAIPTKANLSHMVALDAAGTRAFVANIGSGSITAIDLAAHELLAVIETGAGSEGIAVHGTRGEVWVANRQANTLSVVDGTELRELAELDCGAFPIRVAFTPDGVHALVSCANAGTLEIWDVAKRTRVHEIPMLEQAVDPKGGQADGKAGDAPKAPVPVGILVQPDGAFAFVANTQVDQLSVIDLSTWKLVRRIAVHGEPDGMTWVPGHRSK